MALFLLELTRTDAAVEATIPDEGDDSGANLIGLESALRDKLASVNGGLVFFYWLPGPLDGIGVVEATSDTVIEGLRLWLGQKHHMRATARRAFSTGEMAGGTNTVAEVNYRCLFGASPGASTQP